MMAVIVPAPVRFCDLGPGQFGRRCILTLNHRMLVFNASIFGPATQISGIYLNADLYPLRG